MKADKKETLMKLRTAQSIYLVFSKCSRMPFRSLVIRRRLTIRCFCILYKEAAEEGVKKLTGSGEQVQLIETEEFRCSCLFIQDSFLWASMHSWWMRDRRRDRGSSWNELVRRPDVPEGKARVENPQMHLTALYFCPGAQKTWKRNGNDRETTGIK